jgi:hypothetical protein
MILVWVPMHDLRLPADIRLNIVKVIRSLKFPCLARPLFARLT